MFMRGFKKGFISLLAAGLGLLTGISLGQPLAVHASGSVELYAEGELLGTYSDIMSAFAKMTDASKSYTVGLTDAGQVYTVVEDYRAIWNCMVW